MTTVGLAPAVSTCDVSVTLEAPFLTRTTEIGGFGVDTPLLVDGEGTPYIPGSHVLGKVRHALKHLAMLLDEDPRGVLFATPWSDFEEAWLGGDGDREGDTPDLVGTHRGRVFFSDLKLVKSDVAPDRQVDEKPKVETSSWLRTRIAIDPLSGTALDGALQVLEDRWPSGTRLTFEGKLRLLGTTEAAKTARTTLATGLDWITQMGGMRTVGFGRIVESHISKLKGASPAVSAPASPDRIGYELRFEEPFCVADGRRSQNTFESTDTIPGGVIKGALANALAAVVGSRPSPKTDGGPIILGPAFAQMRVSHAFPCGGIAHGRPQRPPESLASIAVVDRDANGEVTVKRELIDLALVDGPLLVNGYSPSFSPDFKSESPSAFVGWPDVKYELRVRTAMDFEARAAAPAKLFALETVRTEGLVWRGDIDLSGVSESDRGDLVQELGTIVADGLVGIGKTGAFAEMKLVPADAPQWEPNADGRLVLTLQTSTLLRTPNGTYDEAFADLLPGLRLIRSFVRERVAGAQFMAERYFRGADYKPWLLTSSGSVFVFEGIDASGLAGWSDRVKEFLDRGLPFPQSVKTFWDIPEQEEEQWQRCPWVRNAGYAEVTADSELHRRLAPNSGTQKIEIVGGLS